LWSNSWHRTHKILLAVPALLLYSLTNALFVVYAPLRCPYGIKYGGFHRGIGWKLLSFIIIRALNSAVFSLTVLSANTAVDRDSAEIIGVTDFRRWLDLITSIFASLPWQHKLAPAPLGSLTARTAVKRFYESVVSRPAGGAETGVRPAASAVARKQIRLTRWSVETATIIEIVAFVEFVANCQQTATCNSHRSSNLSPRAVTFTSYQ